MCLLSTLFLDQPEEPRREEENVFLSSIGKSKEETDTRGDNGVSLENLSGWRFKSLSRHTQICFLFHAEVIIVPEVLSPG